MTDAEIPSDETDEALWTRINAEVARIPWPELERHFARGVVMRVAADLDLVRVAMAVVRDHGDRVREWIDAGRLAPASDDDAQQWLRQWRESSRPMWAVVAAPWVLVQEVRCSAIGSGGGSIE